MSNQKKFKVGLVGDGRVGKTALRKKLRITEFEEKYVSTMGERINLSYLEISIKENIGVDALLAHIVSNLHF
jgi:GTPase SAR1 family protein